MLLLCGVYGDVMGVFLLHGRFAASDQIYPHRILFCCFSSLANATLMQTVHKYLGK